jgi:hypothetical protein
VKLYTIRVVRGDLPVSEDEARDKFALRCGGSDQCIDSRQRLLHIVSQQIDFISYVTQKQSFSFQVMDPS